MDIFLQTQDVSFYQEDILDGTFVIDLGDALESITPMVLDEIINPKDLERIEKNHAELEEENEATDDGTESTNEEDEATNEDDEATYD